MSDFIAQRRGRAANAWNLAEDVVLIGAGELIPIPGGSDQRYPFRAHPEYRYLTDREIVGGVLAYDPHTGWIDFVPPLTEDDQVWEGKTACEGEPLPQLAGWLAARRGRTLVLLGAELAGVSGDRERAAELREKLSRVRRAKDEVELGYMTRAANATIAGYATLPDLVRPGLTERQLQIELEAAFFRAGGDGTAYGSIVGAGPNSIVFHFTPTARPMQTGELLLIDAGAEVNGYACDVTRTCAVGANLSPRQRAIYDIVLEAEKRGIERCVRGAEYREIHMGACRDMAAGLIHLGLMRGTVDGLIEQDAHALFFPHGVGHLVGLGVRDASGYLPGRKRSERPGLRYLRMDLKLEEGFVTTIEPGLYFIPALLNKRENRQVYRDAIQWTKVDEYLGFGGIRIEDNVLITRQGPQVLTAAIPK